MLDDRMGGWSLLLSLCVACNGGEDPNEATGVSATVGQQSVGGPGGGGEDSETGVGTTDDVVVTGSGGPTETGGTGDSDGETGDSDGETSDGGVDPPCVGSGFADTPTVWSVPVALNVGSFADGFCEPYTYSTLDLDGNGKGDLVATSDCDDQTALGSTHWLVYQNTGSGFADQPSMWSVPAILDAGSPGSTYCEPYTYTLLDLAGDGLADLVATSDCDDQTPLGTSHWLVFENTGSGFAEDPTSWSVPPELNAHQPGWGLCEPYSFVLLDLEGDGRSDLVVTSDCDDQTALGTSEWWVYPNTGSGFAAESHIWSLPVFLDVEWPVSSYCEPYTYTLLDLDGDGLPELVATSDCDDQTPLGSTQWQLFANTGSGFADQPETWPVPAVLAAESFGSDNCDPYAYVSADYDRDGRVDLVATTDCDDQTPLGTSHWLIYGNTGAGFAESPSQWSVPAELDAGSLSSVYCEPYAYVVSDVDGDQVPDLVATSDCDDNQPVGNEHWLVYRGLCG
ncbi:FG-GAP repeat domain-containing protein [Nannocystis punicea]|uniref:VCBS repeat-containing protein n=1 Tax=Nannocystis punicea TaxID=2995304 RepID=A0ABY7HC29_9BACT|nr:VCBS repeat-containing protein [Nannocystis poenicansa]WAS96640.1 VCBS repeat-containing protein [Nannocystis poenicansa]